jgi:monoterpene epsilon-lactone hydrolase
MTSEAFDATVAMLASTNIIGEVSVQDRRATFDGLGALLGLAPGTTTEDVDAGGIPARWVYPTGTAEQRITRGSDGGEPAVLWLHGGGYNIGSVESHTPAASHLAAALGAPVLIADYRLAPEHPSPAALEDAAAVWQWLVTNVANPASLGIVGDSAGGGLALTLTVRLRDSGAALPGALALLSPWIDLSGSVPVSDERVAADVVLTPDLLAEWATAYAADTPLDAPDLSPLGADLRGLPPMLVCAAGRDILCDQARQLHARGTAAGVPIDLVVAEDMIHAWQIFAGAFPEAGESLVEVAAWLGPQLGGA